MNNICPNPGCGAVYQIGPQHVGKRLACKKCAAPLVVTDYGLQLDSGVTLPATGVPPPPADAVTIPETAPPPARPAAPWAAGAWTRFRTWLGQVADAPTWLFGSGAFLVIVYLFFPLIDQAKVRRREALLVAGDVREARLDAELQKKEKATDEEKERRKKNHEAWLKEKSALEEDVEAAEIAQRRATYWYRYGTMLGFLLLTFGSLGYLKPSQPLIRRILGCVVLVAILLSIFNSFAGLGVRIDIGGR
jgi:hypothetical protein